MSAVDSPNRKRIVKNTAFLYMRMLVVMAVTFYTSRVVLHALGEVNYGIYDVVGGIVTMMSFINGSLAASTSRFLTYELGKKNQNGLDQTFSASLILHFVAAIFVVLLGESIGVWFLYNKMTIPDSQMTPAFWILQFSIVTTCFNFTQVPYNASIISHENMAIFAYIGLYEAFAKLGISFLIQLCNSDRLILYGFLIMLNAIVVQTFYRIYTRKKYPECRFRLVKDPALYKKLLGYSGWDVFGNIAVIFQSQGVNIVLNVFYGPVLNAARAIAVQVQSGLKAFVTNFLMAVRPRVVKLYAEENYASMYKLTFYACKIAYFLMFALILPIAFEMDFILKIWLNDKIPQYTNIFTWIILGIVLTDTFHSAYLMAYHAIGKIKLGNLICGTLMILTLPLGYMALKFGMPPYSIFIIILGINIICHIISWFIVHSYHRFSFRKLFTIVYLRCFIVSILSLLIPSVVVFYMEESWLRFIVLLVSSEFCYLLLVYYLGFSKAEKEELVDPIILKLKLKLFHR